MILVKKLTKEEILDVVSALVEETLPEGVHGKIHARYNFEQGIEVTVITAEEESVQILN